MGRRSVIEIISQILDVANRSSSSCTPTKVQIMYNAFLSYNQTTEYPKILTEDGLLSYDPATAGRHNTTENGLRYLRQLCNKIGDVIRMNKKEDEQREEIRQPQQQQQRVKIRKEEEV